MRLILLHIAMTFLLTSFGQGIVNDGSHLVIETGNSLVLTGNFGFQNQSNGNYHGNINLNGNFYIPGDWENNATEGNIFENIENPPNGTVHFIGANEQYIGGSASTIFENMLVNNSTLGNALCLSNDQKIEGTLTFIDGIIQTSAHKIVIDNNAEEAIIGYNNNSYINGNVRRNVTLGSYDFPVGTIGAYEIANIKINVLGSTTFIDASFSNISPGIPPENLMLNGTRIQSFLDYGYWTITPDNTNGIIYDITATMRGHTNGAALASMHSLFLRQSGGDWQNFGYHNNNTQSGYGSNPITAKRTTATNFGDYAIGLNDNFLLPIVLKSFDISCQNGLMNIWWSTASETNSDYFVIQSTNDMKNWIDLKTIKSAGNSNELKNYSVIIPQLSSANIYVRLKQVDLNGDTEFFKAHSITCNWEDKKTDINDRFFIFPNPASDELNITLKNMIKDDTANIIITSVTGEEIITFKKDITESETLINLIISSLNNGIYMISIESKDLNISNIKLVIQH